MTIFYPDISSFQGGISLKGALAVCCKATQGTNYANPDFPRARAEASNRGTFFMAYHFLTHGSAAKQAEWCFMNVGRWTPLMLDVEPTTGSTPTIADVATFIAEYRKLGGILHLIYLPHWYWQALGSPSLSFLKEADLRIVSSQYQRYADSGGGWASYGGATPAVWQYSDGISFNGFRVDFNAYRGTLDELKSIARTGHLPAPPPAPGTAVNPVTGLRVNPRYTQVDIAWDAAKGAESYRVILWDSKANKQIRSTEVKGTAKRFRFLRMGRLYHVTVLALPATAAASAEGRANANFATKGVSSHPIIRIGK